ncbi:hypothetical protein [Flavisolibacter nicotianae]|uniref:hypothetical protein n=1 Tax=Flavisolibacter nicotianae TaxID=2364882 RepID=UPI000EAD890C|nr:hypothetical protein [Flavisolibacter nicotianae]
MKKGAPVDARPADLATYGLNAQIGNGNYVVYIGSGNVFDVWRLPTSTDYYFAVFEYNGSSRPVYQAVPPATSVVTTNERPTINSSSFAVERREGNQLDFRYKLGNGSARIIVAREGNPVTAVPTDGTVYTGNLSFGGTGSSDLGGGQYVIYNGSNVNESGTNLLSLKSLQRNTTYHFTIFEYDLDSQGRPVYLVTNAATTSGTTYDEPTVPATGLTAQAITDNGASFQWNPGNGTGRILLGRKGGPVNASPADLVNYPSSINFGSGSVLNGDTYVLSESQTGSTVQRLQCATEYHFAVFEYIGYFGKLYLDADPARVNFVTAIRPTIAASSLAFGNPDGNSIGLSWANGNGRGRVILARKGSPVTATSGASGDLKDAVVYEANAVFGQGAEIKPGEFVVYNDSAGTVDTRNSLTVKGLEGNKQYYFAVYEYGQLNGVLQYATVSPATPATLLTGNAFTSRPPTIAARQPSVSALANRSLGLNWVNGSGEIRIVVAKAGGPVDALPADLADYNASAAFGTGAEIGSGNFVVYKGTGSSVSLTNLLPATTYHFAVIEANGRLAPVFQNASLTPPLATSATTLERPTKAASAIVFSNTGATGFTLSWTRGNGGKCLVVMREGTSLTAKPLDGQVYPANAVLGAGTDISTDGSRQYAVYNGTGNTVDVTGLQPGSTYYVTVFEFEEPATIGTAYLTLSTANSLAQFVAAPLVQSSGLHIRSFSNGVLQLDWTNGSGQKRILLAKEGAAVDAVPTDNVSYAANNLFGTGQQVGNGNFVVFNGTTSTATVSNLKPNTAYHFALFEYNAFGAAVLYRTTDPARTATLQESTLPVAWLSVGATEKDGKVLVEWATAQETGVDSYTVEKSRDGILFSAVATVAATGRATQPSTYSANDPVRSSGSVYYRIKEVDVDGRFSYSKIVRVSSGVAGDVCLLQNPVHGTLRFSVSADLVGKGYFITDATGRPVASGQIGGSLMTVLLPAPGAGVYYLVCGEERGGQRIIPFVRY